MEETRSVKAWTKLCLPIGEELSEREEREMRLDGPLSFIRASYLPTSE
jgi:hypothetical protein